MAATKIEVLENAYSLAKEYKEYSPDIEYCISGENIFLADKFISILEMRFINELVSLGYLSSDKGKVCNHHWIESPKSVTSVLPDVDGYQQAMEWTECDFYGRTQLGIGYVDFTMFQYLSSDVICLPGLYEMEDGGTPADDSAFIQSLLSKSLLKDLQLWNGSSDDSKSFRSELLTNNEWATDFDIYAELDIVPFYKDLCILMEKNPEDGLLRDVLNLIGELEDMGSYFSCYGSDIATARLLPTDKAMYVISWMGSYSEDVYFSDLNRRLDRLFLLFQLDIGMQILNHRYDFVPDKEAV